MKSAFGKIKFGTIYKNPESVRREFMSYEIPDFCSCKEIYNDAKALLMGKPETLFKKQGDKMILVLDAGTTLIKWKPKAMRKFLRKKIEEAEKRCN